MNSSVLQVLPAKEKLESMNSIVETTELQMKG